MTGPDSLINNVINDVENLHRNQPTVDVDNCDDDDLELHAVRNKPSSMSEIRPKRNSYHVQSIEAKINSDEKQVSEVSKTDTNIFSSSCNYCGLNAKRKNKSCDHLRRVIPALRYYSGLDLENNINDRDTLLRFFDEYSLLLNDYIHVMQSHNSQQDLQEISETGLQSCGRNCKILKQRYRRRYEDHRITGNMEDDARISVYVDLLDSLHFHLFHMHDTGYRMSRSDISKLQDDDDTKIDTDWEYEFKKIKRKILAKSKGFGNELNYQTVSKYNYYLPANYSTAFDDQSGLSQNFFGCFFSLKSCIEIFK